MKSLKRRSEFSRDVDELLEEYVSTEHKFAGMHMHIPKSARAHRGVDIGTTPPSAGALIYDKSTGAMKMFTGSAWVELAGVKK